MSLGSFQICNTVSLSIVTLWYIASSGLTYFVTDVCTFCRSLLVSPTPYPPPLATTSLFTEPVILVCLCVCQVSVVAVVVVDSAYKWDPKVFLFLWLISTQRNALKAHPCCCKMFVFQSPWRLPKAEWAWPVPYRHEYSTLGGKARFPRKRLGGRECPGGRE